MSLTTNTPLESARRKFFMISTYMMCRCWIQPFLDQEAKMSLTANTRSNRRKENFS